MAFFLKYLNCAKWRDGELCVLSQIFDFLPNFSSTVSPRSLSRANHVQVLLVGTIRFHNHTSTIRVSLLFGIRHTNIYISPRLLVCCCHDHHRHGDLAVVFLRTSHAITDAPHYCTADRSTQPNNTSMCVSPSKPSRRVTSHSPHSLSLHGMWHYILGHQSSKRPIFHSCPKTRAARSCCTLFSNTKLNFPVRAILQMTATHHPMTFLTHSRGHFLFLSKYPCRLANWKSLCIEKKTP